MAPLTGAAFAILLAVTLILAGEGVDPKDGVDEVVEYYSDNEDQLIVSGFLGGLAAVLFLFFAGWLRKVLRDAEGPGGVLSAVSFGGAIVFAVGGAIASTLSIGLAESFDDIDPTALEAMNAIAWNYFIPFAVGFSVFMLATGICAVRHGGLPRWLAWSAIVLGVATYTPAGFFTFLLGLVWVLVASILLTVRARAA